MKNLFISLIGNLDRICVYTGASLVLGALAVAGCKAVWPDFSATYAFLTEGITAVVAGVIFLALWLIILRPCRGHQINEDRARIDRGFNQSES